MHSLTHGKKEKTRWVYYLKGDEKSAICDHLFNQTEVKQLPDIVKAGMREPYGFFLSWAFFNFGGLQVDSIEPLPEASLNILSRFGKVFDLTYTRFNDLKQAEAQAREVVKQAALDRIRADIASMRTVGDLDAITPLIWNELTTLGVSFLRCGVFIMDDTKKLSHTFLSTPDGKAIAAFHLPYDTFRRFAQVVKHWKEKTIYADHWDMSEFANLADTLVQQGAVSNRNQYMNTLPHEGIYLHFLPFLQGMLYVGNTSRLAEEQMELISQSQMHFPLLMPGMKISTNWKRLSSR
jgi:hypothetical protein